MSLGIWCGPSKEGADTLSGWSLTGGRVGDWLARSDLYETKQKTTRLNIHGMKEMMVREKTSRLYV